VKKNSMVVHTCHPSYVGDTKHDCSPDLLGQEKQKPAPKITIAKRAGEVAPGVDHLLCSLVIDLLMFFMYPSYPSEIIFPLC
jgi:hypothetical protein